MQLLDLTVSYVLLFKARHRCTRLIHTVEGMYILRSKLRLSAAASAQDDVLSTICQHISEIEDLKHLELACYRLKEIGGFDDSKKKGFCCRYVQVYLEHGL